MARPSLVSVCAVSLGFGTIVGGVQSGLETDLALTYVTGLSPGLGLVAQLAMPSPKPVLRHLPKIRLGRSNAGARTGVLAILP